MTAKAIGFNAREFHALLIVYGTSRASEAAAILRRNRALQVRVSADAVSGPTGVAMAAGRYGPAEHVGAEKVHPL
jgi:hypothetical protein